MIFIELKDILNDLLEYNFLRSHLKPLKVFRFKSAVSNIEARVRVNMFNS